MVDKVEHFNHKDEQEVDVGPLIQGHSTSAGQDNDEGRQGIASMVKHLAQRGVGASAPRLLAVNGIQRLVYEEADSASNVRRTGRLI